MIAPLAPIVRLTGVWLRALVAISMLMTWAWPQSVPSAPLSQPVPASTPQDKPDGGTGDLRALRERIADPQKREELLTQLDALIKAQSGGVAKANTGGPGFLADARVALSGFAHEVGRLLILVETLPQLPARIANLLDDPDSQGRWLHRVAQLALLLAAGAVFFTASLIAVRRGIRVASASGQGDWPVLAPIARAIAMLIPAAGAFVTVLMASRMTAIDDTVAILAIAIAAAFTLTQWLLRSVGECLTPRLGSPLPGITESTRRNSMRWLRIVGVFAILGGCASIAGEHLGLAADTAWMLLRFVGLIVTLALAVTLVRFRALVSALIQGSATSRSLRGRLASLWHGFALLLIAGLYVGIFVNGAAGAGGVLQSLMMTVFIFALAMAVVAGLRRLLSRLLHDNGTSPSRFLQPLRRIVTIVVYGLAILALLQTWGMPIVAWLRSSTGRSIAATMVSLLVIVLTTMLVLEVATALTDRVLQRHQGIGGAYGGINARRQTLLPLVRNVIRVVVLALATLMVLSEIGVNIGPLLAGAGIIGIAIGFGAQSLVQDVITGFFMLVEDTVSVGDWVSLGGGHDGEVESLSIRSMRLRDLEGNIHTVPFSKVSSIVNMTRLFSYALIDLRLSYRDDVDDVITLLNDTAGAMGDDPEWGAILLGPLEVFGINTLHDSWLELRVRLKTRPGDQWRVRREFLRRIKGAFERADLEVPYPQRILRFERQDDTGPDPSPVHVVIHPRTNETTDR